MSDSNLHVDVDSMRDTSRKYKDYSNSMLSEFKSLKKLGNDLGENAWNGNAANRFNDLFNEWCDLAASVIDDLENSGNRLEANSIQYNDKDTNSAENISNTINNNPINYDEYRINL